ncbi:hypothetical protein LR48_Vigan04g132300 [Vigna angularis]|uniref:Uncharacterized protein n=1 Tax=Phaseolus angularis TaxID=3914 RepID=A0A0L9UDX0_PHAAN|nr:hypothetical protein LR48_Vigan04g132300 [Vigna angularis]
MHTIDDEDSLDILETSSFSSRTIENKVDDVPDHATPCMTSSGSGPTGGGGRSVTQMPDVTSRRVNEKAVTVEFDPRTFVPIGDMQHRSKVYRLEKQPIVQPVNEAREEAEDHDAISILTSRLNKLRKGPVEMLWELRTFGLECHIPLYINFDDAYCKTLEPQELT